MNITVSFFINPHFIFTLRYITTEKLFTTTLIGAISVMVILLLLLLILMYKYKQVRDLSEQ